MQSLKEFPDYFRQRSKDWTHPSEHGGYDKLQPQKGPNTHSLNRPRTKGNKIIFSSKKTCKISRSRKTILSQLITKNELLLG